MQIGIEEIVILNKYLATQLLWTFIISNYYKSLHYFNLTFKCSYIF